MAAFLVFCTAVVLPLDLSEPMSPGIVMAWADDDDDDDDDETVTAAPVAAGSGTSGAAPAAGATQSVGSSGLAVSTPARMLATGADRSTDRQLDTDGALPADESWKALSTDERLVAVRTGGWNRPYRAHAVREDLLVLGISPSEVKELEAVGFGLVDRTTLGALGLVAIRFSLPPGRDLRSALRLARSRAPGAIMEPNFIYRYAGRPTPAICEDGECHGHTLVGWQQIAESCGTGIRIGMTDTGIDRDHPALRDRVVRTRVFDPYGQGSVPDHGTAVAGLLVGNAETGFPGMLPGAELFAADVFHTNDSGDSFSTLLSLVQGLDWLVANGVSVVNVSMTGPPNALLEETVDRINQQGVVVVAAAGNGGPVAPPAYPAAYGDVVSVTAVDHELRPYSMANRGAYISFSSPGVRIWSADSAGAGRHRTGTSFAAAHASAIIADVIRRDGAVDVNGALKALQSTARDLGAPGKDPVFGWGLIQGTPACQS